MEQKIFFISGKRLSDARKEAKLSQEELGKKIGASRQTINVWEKREEVEITSDQAAKITKLLRVTMNDLTTAKSMDGAVVADPTQELISRIDAMMLSKDKEIERLESFIEHLKDNNNRYWQHIEDLTKGFGSLQKAK